MYKRHKLWLALFSLYPAIGFAADPTAPNDPNIPNTNSNVSPTQSAVPPIVPKPYQPVGAIPPNERLVLSATLGLTHDSNVFRLSPNADERTVINSSARSDTIRRAGVGIKMDLPISRQRLILGANIEDNNFNRFSNLNYVSGDATAAWKWQIGNLWDGRVGYTHRRFLAGFANLQTNTRDLIDQNVLSAEAARWIHPRWKVRGAANWLESSHSDPTQQALERRVKTGVLGADYYTPSNNSIGAQIRVSEGQYPNRQVVAGSQVDNQYREYEPSVVARWMITGASTVDARLGYTDRRYKQISARDFSGATWRVNYDWVPTGITRFNFSTWREIVSLEDVNANDVLSDGISISPRWEPTAKIAVVGRLAYERQRYEGDPGFVLTTVAKRKDTLRTAQLGVIYTPLRNTELGVTYERGNRSSNQALADYKYHMLSANVKFLF